MEYTEITQADVDRLDGLDDWRAVLGTMRAEFAAGSYPAAAALTVAIAEAAEAAEHHPDIDIRYPDRVRVSLMTHATGGLTTRDTDLAMKISALAAGAGAAADPGAAQALEVAIDTMDADRIRPFWAAVLGYVSAGDQLVDPARQGPVVWFQEMTEPRPDRNRIHLDVSVPHDTADERIEAALAAGGRMVSDARARAFWVLADADGNEVCVCTWEDRAG